MNINVFIASLSLVAVCFPVVSTAHDVAPEGLTVYQADNILRNGDFQQRALNRNAPAHWSPATYFNGDLPEEMPLYSLENGTLQMKSPGQGILQSLDVTPVTAWNYTLSFEAEVESGTLDCSVSGSKKWFSTQIKEGKSQRYIFHFKLDEKVSAETLDVAFRPKDDGAVVRINHLSLKPSLPESKTDAIVLFIDDAGKKVPLRGIAVADNDSAFEHFYDLKAAQYFQKYLYVSYGRVISIYTGNKDSIKSANGMVCFGNSFFKDNEIGKVTVGGYILKARRGNIYAGGKDDGAVHGAFALLSGMGLEFFATLNDFTLATRNVIKLDRSTMIRNPAFGYRTSTWPIKSLAPLGESCAELWGNSLYMGQWVASDHTNGILVDPFIYFKDHPEYYALKKDGKRSWQKKQTQPLLDKAAIIKETVSNRYRLDLCWSNPEVQRIATESVLKWFQLCPETKMISVIQGDCNDPSELCQCDQCKNFGASCTDRYLRFVNIIAKAVKEKYPEKQILAWAYIVTGEPPVKVIPESNVFVTYCACADAWSLSGNESTLSGPQSVRGIKEVAAWKKTGIPLGCALYFPTSYEAVNKMRFFGKNGATTLFEVFENRNDYLTSYIMRKFAWNLATDVEPVIDHFMDYYYGPAAPVMRQYFNLIEAKKLDFSKNSSHGYLQKDQIPLVVDDVTLVKGGEYLNQAATLVLRNDGKRMIAEQKLQFLNSYLMRNSSVFLHDTDLERFANCLAEALKLAKALNSKEPTIKATYKEMIRDAADIDIGDTQPWYNSPIVQKIEENPLGMVKANKKATYLKTKEGLEFNLHACPGGDVGWDYQYEGIPVTKRPFAKVMRRASTSKSILRAEFTLSGVPEKAVFLDLMGFGSHDVSIVKVLVNGEAVFEGENTFGNRDWKQMRIPISAKVLKQGMNTLEIRNSTPDKFAAVADIYGDSKEYYSAWFMIAEAKLLFADETNPVVEKEP